MNTPAEALKQLETAIAASHQASDILDDLLVAHDYQDVALLVSKAAGKLLEAAAHLLREEDEMAFVTLEESDDLLETFYKVMDEDFEDDEL
ncbi:MAG: hypothetical protein ACOYL5_04525 [Phototrophicaceae bacterium]|jgi:hypothetical protein